MYDFLGISDYAEIVEDEGDYSSPDGKYDFCCHGYKFMNKVIKIYIWYIMYT